MAVRDYKSKKSIIERSRDQRTQKPQTRSCDLRVSAMTGRPVSGGQGGTRATPGHRSNIRPPTLPTLKFMEEDPE
jgi:hypothetical protein